MTTLTVFKNLKLVCQYRDDCGSDDVYTCTNADNKHDDKCTLGTCPLLKAGRKK